MTVTGALSAFRKRPEMSPHKALPTSKSNPFGSVVAVPPIAPPESTAQRRAFTSTWQRKQLYFRLARTNDRAAIGGPHRNQTSWTMS